MKRLAPILASLALLLPASAQAFSVSPAVIDLSGARGATASASLTVKNDDAREKTYYLQAVKFAPREESSAPRFIPYEEDHAGLPEWLSFEKRVRVPASGALEVPVKVAVPADAASGTRHAAILVSDAPYDVVAAQGAPIQARVAVLLFFTVEGETEAKAALLDFVPTAPAGVRTDAAVPFRARVQNQGNVVAVPRGNVTLTDLFGRTVAAAEVNAEAGRIIPGTTRTFEGALAPSAFALGPMTATLELSYAPDAPALRSSFSFFLLPVPAVALAGVLALIALLLIAARAFRRA